MMADQPGLQIAALGADTWMRKLLVASGFRETHSVVVLSWDSSAPLAPPRYSGYPRVMSPGDLEQVYQLDYLCFDPLWRNSKPAIELAHKQAAFATVVEDGGKILGFQVSTPSPNGGHLARLGVDPEMQGKGIGYALVYDLLVRFSNQGATLITVNTQSENQLSLSLYAKLNFQLTGHRYLVFEHKGK
jgi:ribosomal-protein-alanine N-acetyltransferase